VDAFFQRLAREGGGEIHGAAPGQAPAPPRRGPA
jgi:hypothetical protein